MQHLADGNAPNAKNRTHLANERTFLAWLRTGLTCMALGMAALQVLDEHEIGGIPLTRVIAALLVALGIWLVVLGRWRFRQAAIGIRDDTFTTRRRGFEVVVLAMTIVGLIALLIVARSPLTS